MGENPHQKKKRSKSAHLALSHSYPYRRVRKMVCTCKTTQTHADTRRHTQTHADTTHANKKKGEDWVQSLQSGGKGRHVDAAVSSKLGHNVSFENFVQPFNAMSRSKVRAHVSIDWRVQCCRKRTLIGWRPSPSPRRSSPKKKTH